MPYFKVSIFELKSQWFSRKNRARVGCFFKSINPFFKFRFKPLIFAGFN